MSWNASIQFAKLYKAYLALSTTALTNPMIANLNMNSYNVNNVNTINAIAGTPLTLYADPAQGITVNTKMTIPNHPLVITNNTADDSFQVGDSIGDTTIFRVDANGNIGIKSNPSATLGHTLVVNGTGNFTGHINVPTQPLGTNDTTVATTAFVLANGGGGGGSQQINTLNFYRPLFPSLLKQSIIYNASTTTITSASIEAQLDGFPSTPTYISYGVERPLRYVIVGDGTANNIAVSTDGINYQGLGLIFSTWGASVAYSPSLNRWVAVGKGTTTMFYSDDAFSWTAVPSSTSILAEGQRVFWNGTRFLAGGLTGSNTIATSLDGISWIIQGATTFSTCCAGFATNGEITVAVGRGGNNIAYSWDGGLTWTGLGAILADTGGFSVIWTGTRFIATFQDNTGTGNSIAYSNDGISWTGQGLVLDPLVYGVASNNVVQIAVGGYSNQMVASYNGGVSWNIISSTLDGLGFCVLWSGSLWIAVGSGTYNYVYSADGSNWIESTSAHSIIETSIRGIACNSERANRINFPVNTIVVSGGTGSTLSYSTDNGLSWKNVSPTPFSTQCYNVAYGNGLWVGFGQGGNTLAYSYNGKNWIGNGTAIHTTSARGGVYGSRWVSVGQGGNSIAHSTDGINWTGLGTTMFTSGLVAGYGAGTFVVGGQTGANTLAYSTTGTSFNGAGNTLFTTACNAVAHNGVRFAVGGSGGNSLGYSSDGITYSPVSGSTSIFTNCRSIAWNGTIFLATGTGANVFASSTDGITWTPLGGSSVFSSGGQEVFWAGNKWIALGSGGAFIAISTDATGTSWVKPQQTQFSSLGLGGAWNGSNSQAIIPATSIVLNSTNNKKLDLVPAPYGVNNITNLTITIKA